MQRIRIFLSANKLISHRLLSQRYNSLLTFLEMQSPWKWAYLELQKVKMSEALKLQKRPAYFYINSGKLKTTLAPSVDQTKQSYTSNT